MEAPVPLAVLAVLVGRAGLHAVAHGRPRVLVAPLDAERVVRAFVGLAVLDGAVPARRGDVADPRAVVGTIGRDRAGVADARLAAADEGGGREEGDGGEGTHAAASIADRVRVRQPPLREAAPTC